MASTIVSTDMVRKIAESYNVDFKICLTGFKWIAKLINDFDHLDFIGGGEESFGFMVGDFTEIKMQSLLPYWLVGNCCLYRRRR